MNSVSFGKQTIVYFGKVSRIALREKSWKLVVFAAIISFIVATVTGENMFDNFEATKSGIFNSIQRICKEHDIIRSEYRQGMKLSSYIAANVMWQAVLCLVQSIIIFLICLCFGFFGENAGEVGVIRPAFIEYFITIYLLTFGSSVLAIMVSSISGTPLTAMTIMPFVLILQLIMCGVLFDLKEGGFADIISNGTYSKWGMSAFGATADLNELESKVLIMVKGNAKIYAALKSKFPPVDAYDPEVINLVGSWINCIIITIASAVISVLGLKIKNRDS